MIRIGLIGCGQIATRRYIPAILNSKQCQLAAICTAHGSTAEANGAALGCRFTTAYQTILSDDSVDAVIIATPHPLHAPIAAEALQARKHVLIEKPLATSWEQACHLAKVAERSDRVVMALPYDATPEFMTLLAELRESVIGRLTGIEAHSSASGPPPGKDWKLSQQSAGGGVLIAQGVYALSQVASILGPAKALYARGGTLIKRRRATGGLIPSDIDDHWAIQLEYETGQLVSLRLSWACDQGMSIFMVHGVSGAACLVDGTDVYVRTHREPPRGRASRALPGFVAVRRVKHRPSILEHFLTCIVEQKPSIAGLAQALHVTEQMIKAQQSNETGRQVALTTGFRSWWQPDGKLLDLSDMTL